MGGPLPLGEPAPADGALPAGTVIDGHTDFGVYLHVPFCRVRCGYCDFNTYTSDELRGARQDQYADVLLARGRARARGCSPPRRRCARHPPSSSAAARRPCCPRAIWRACSTACAAPSGWRTDAEITVEANPDTVTRCRCRRARRGRGHPPVDRHAVRRSARAGRARSHARPRPMSPTGGRRGPRGPASRSASTSSTARRASRWRTGRRRSRRRSRSAGPHLGLRADHRGRHEARAADPPRRGARTRRRPAGRHVRAGRRGCSAPRASTGTR